MLGIRKNFGRLFVHWFDGDGALVRRILSYGICAEFETQCRYVKKCSKCKNEKPFDDFGVHNGRSDGLQVRCKECRRTYQNDWYSRNPKLHQKRVAKARNASRKRFQIFIWKYLESHPCVMCGESNILLLDFDHLEEKDRNISAMGGLSIESIMKEIDKCQILCVSCHRKKTAKDFKWAILDYINEKSCRESAPVGFPDS